MMAMVMVIYNGKRVSVRFAFNVPRFWLTLALSYSCSLWLDLWLTLSLALFRCL